MLSFISRTRWAYYNSHPRQQHHRNRAPSLMETAIASSRPGRQSSLDLRGSADSNEANGLDDIRVAPASETVTSDGRRAASILALQRFWSMYLHAN